MTFKQLLEDTSWKEVKESLIKNYDADMKNDGCLESHEMVFYKLYNIEPVNPKDNMRICIDWVEPDGDLVEEGYWSVCGRKGKLLKDSSDFEKFKDNCTEEEANREITYGIEFTSWNEMLGMEVDKDTANNIELTRADIVSHILFEMTFISYDEEEIQDALNSLKEQVDRINNMTDEEKEKNCKTFKDVEEMLKWVDELDDDYVISYNGRSIKVSSEVFEDNSELENILKKNFPGTIRGSGNEINRDLENGKLTIFPFVGVDGTTFEINVINRKGLEDEEDI